MTHRSARAIRVAVLLAAVAVSGGCSSSSKTGSVGSPATSSSSPSGSQSTSASPPSGSPSTSSSSAANPPTSSSDGGITMSAPHIACSQGPVTKTYDGAQTNPVELCVSARTLVRLMITPPAGQTWALPTATPQSMLVTHASRSGASVLMELSAIRTGTVTVAVPHTAWRLLIAVI